jgi:hypothetical protein
MSRFEADWDMRTITMPVEQPGIRDGLIEELAEKGWQLKHEFHVTVAHRELIKGIAKASFTDLAEILNENGDNLSMEYAKYLMHISRPKITGEAEYPREALVTPVSSHSLEMLIHQSSQAVGIKPIRPFLHLTMFTRPDNPYARRGISIADRKAWHRLHRKIYGGSWQAEQAIER